VQQADGVARNQPAERVADDAQLGDAAAAALDGPQLVLDLDAHALAAELDAVVGEGAAVALDRQDVQLVGRVLGAQAGGDGGHVVGVAPELRVLVRVLCSSAGG
jgi:hypothetical protein